MYYMSDTKKNRILTAALTVFLRYGYKRVNMNDIAEAAGISRPALYLVFKNKEEIFIGVFHQWVSETLEEIERSVLEIDEPIRQIETAFDIWAVRPFELMMASPEAKELIECSFDFAHAALRQGYDKLETTLVPILPKIASSSAPKTTISPEKTARVLASAVRGFKQTAVTSDELRQLIKELLILSLRQ